MSMQLALRQIETMECPVCKKTMSGPQYEGDREYIKMFGAKKYCYCPNCGGSAPNTRTANGWFKWCSRFDKYLKSHPMEVYDASHP